MEILLHFLTTSSSVLRFSIQSMSVAQLNNKAMSLLLDGGSQLDAIGILKQALQILRSAPIPTPLVEVCCVV